MMERGAPASASNATKPAPPGTALAPGAGILAAEYAQLLHEQAREAVLCRLHDADTPVAPTADLHRALLSLLLRSSTPHVAHSADDALQAYVANTNAPDAVRLGFSASSSLDAQRGALHDVIGALVHGRMLDVRSAALKYYNTAGCGATDIEEYMEPDAEGPGESRCFGRLRPPLLETRRLALVMYAHHVVRCAPRVLVDDSASLKLLTDKCVVRAHLLHADALAALLSLLSAAYRVSLPHQKAPVEVALVTAISAAASLEKDEERPALGLYLRALHDANLQATCALRFLHQRFGLKCAAFDELTPSLFVDFLNASMSCTSQEYRHVLPALCASLANAWVKNYTPTRFKHQDVELLLVSMEQGAERLVKKCDAPQADNDWLIDVVQAVKICVLLSRP